MLYIASVARWGKIRRVVIMTVEVEMIDQERVGVFGITVVPVNRLSAPVARVTAWPDLVVKNCSVDKYPSIFLSEWVIGHSRLLIIFFVEGLYQFIRSAVAFHALVMEAAKSVRFMWSITAEYTALFTVNIMVNIPIMLLSPMVHLAQATYMIWFIATIDGATFKDFPIMLYIRTPIATKFRCIFIIGTDFNSFSTAFANNRHSCSITSQIGHWIFSLAQLYHQPCNKVNYLRCKYCTYWVHEAPAGG
jgi:hypothetical protein